MGLIWVKAKNPRKVGLWEIDPSHPAPGGEVFVSGDEPVQVAETSLVLEKIASRELVVVEAPKQSAAAHVAHVAAVEAPSPEGQDAGSSEQQPEQHPAAKKTGRG